MGPPPARPFDEQDTLQAPQFSPPPPPPQWGGYPPPPPAGPGWPQPSPVGQGWPQPAPGGPGGPGATPPPARSGLPPKPQHPAVAAIRAHRWLTVGAVSAAVVAVVAAGVLIADSGEAADTTAAPTTAPSSKAGVPAGPTTTVRADTPAPPSPAPTPAPAPAGPVIAPDALAPLLLPVPEAGKLLNSPELAEVGTETAMMGGSVAPPQCMSAFGPAYRAAFEGTGYTGVVIQLLQQGRAQQVAQAVTAFPDPAAAKAVFDTLVAGWNSCQSQRITYTPDGGASRMVDVTTTRTIGDVATVMLIPTDPPVPGQQCERDMTLRGNVIVDVRACSPTVGSAGYAIASAIADKIR